jgi:hypothetical protein
VQGSPEEFLSAAAHLVADVLERFGEATLRVTGGSMFPTLRPGDVVTVRQATADGLVAGDLALVLDGDRLFAHRVVELRDGDEPQLVLRGDSHWANDPPRPAASAIGRIVGVTRRGAALTMPLPCSLGDRLRGLAFGVGAALKGCAINSRTARPGRRPRG